MAARGRGRAALWAAAMLGWVLTVAPRAAAAPNVAVDPNSTGLPGIGNAQSIIGALRMYGYIVAIGGIICGAAYLALATRAGRVDADGKSRVLAAVIAAIVIGAAPTLASFFFDLGTAVK